jgi:hypothetical protein
LRGFEESVEMIHKPTGDNSDSAEAGFRPFAALAFWCCLLLAAGLFAVLSLAPKLRSYRDLAQEYDTLERRLVSTERRTESLSQVADALEHDPQFAAELARINFDARDADERILVGPQLSLAAWDSPAPLDDVHNRPATGALWDGPLLETLSNDRTVRRPLMAASSILLLCAFVLCGGRRSQRVEASSELARGGIRAWLAKRYQKRLH